MKSAGICIAIAVTLAACNFSGQATSQPKQPVTESANWLFQVGKLAERLRSVGKTRFRRVDYPPATTSERGPARLHEAEAYPSALAERLREAETPEHWAVQLSRLLPL
jgi:hypothetical protein